MKTIRVATCQFSVEADIEHNRDWILKQIDQAAEQQARIAQFSECALSGYAGVDIPNQGELHSGNLVDDPRSKDVISL